MKMSAGILLYHIAEEIRILLVHPGGPYYKNKDWGAWSIPKGLVDEGEDKLTAAKREFFEELGQEVQAEVFIALTPVKQAGGKIVYAWAAQGWLDTTTIKSNIFRMEYPYKSGKWIEVPEIDKAAWFELAIAKKKIVSAQARWIDELATIV